MRKLETLVLDAGAVQQAGQSRSVVGPDMIVADNPEPAARSEPSQALGEGIQRAGCDYDFIAAAGRRDGQGPRGLCLAPIKVTPDLAHNFGRTHLVGCDDPPRECGITTCPTIHLRFER